MSSNSSNSGSAGKLSLLDTVALMVDVPEERLVRGQVGAIVELLGNNSFLVEFVDQNGRTYAMIAIKGDRLLRLHHHPMEAA